MRHVSRLALLAGVLVTLGAGSGFAQSAQAPSQRPYRGLFGGGSAGGTGLQTFDFRASVGAGYDDNVLARSTSPGSGPYAEGYLGYATAGLYYDRDMATGHFSADGSAGFTYYPDLDQSSAPRFRGGASYSFTPGARNSVSVAQRVAYSSRYRLYYLSDEGIAAEATPDGTTETAFEIEDEADLSERRILSYATLASFSRRLSKRSTLDAGYRLRVFDDLSGSTEDLSYWSAGVRFRHRVTEHLGVRLGYAYRPSRYGSDENNSYSSHNIDVGVDYDRAFSLSGRRTTLTFGFGSVIYSRESLSSDRSRFKVGVAGQANLVHLFGRSWQGTLTYRRGLTYLAGFNQPFFSDSATAALSGLIARRVEFFAGGTYSTGKPSYSGGQRDYDIYAATAGIRYGLTANLALSANYFYYHYAFDEGISRPPGLAEELDRQGARVGLSFWLPLIR